MLSKICRYRYINIGTNISLEIDILLLLEQVLLSYENHMQRFFLLQKIIRRNGICENLGNKLEFYTVSVLWKLFGTAVRGRIFLWRILWISGLAFITHFRKFSETRRISCAKFFSCIFPKDIDAGRYTIRIWYIYRERLRVFLANVYPCTFDP